MSAEGQHEAGPAPVQGAATTDDVLHSSRRRSRWGGRKEDDLADSLATQGPKKRSRWGAKSTHSGDPVLLAVQLGLPLAMLQHMTVEQQQTLPRLKEQIDEIDVLLRLPDCGVSEIPAAERSPSPDPWRLSRRR